MRYVVPKRILALAFGAALALEVPSAGVADGEAKIHSTRLRAVMATRRRSSRRPSASLGPRLNFNVSRMLYPKSQTGEFKRRGHR